MDRFRRRLQNAWCVMFLVTMATSSAIANSYVPLPENGYPVGLMSECEGVTKNATISENVLSELQVVAFKMGKRGKVVSKNVPVKLAADRMARDKNFDFTKKKTLVHFIGYLEHVSLAPNRMLGETYVKNGYNAFYAHSSGFLSNLYPRSVRIARVVGRKYGDFLVELTKQGLRAEDLHLVGISLGSHVASYAAKHFYAITGKKPARITGLDPSGPCFRSLPEEDRLNPSDGEMVDIIHTNMDGLGIPHRIGHIDFYANGGEFQPPLSLYLPCLNLCSHLKSFIYWMMSWQHQDQYMAIKCDSIQDARMGNCNNTDNVNYFGPKADFSKPGIYYLPVSPYFPYHMGKAGFKEDLYGNGLRQLNSDDNLVVDRVISGWETIWNILSFPQNLDNV